jgi:hypothetical protein
LPGSMSGKIVVPIPEPSSDPDSDPDFILSPDDSGPVSPTLPVAKLIAPPPPSPSTKPVQSSPGAIPMARKLPKPPKSS